MTDKPKTATDPTVTEWAVADQVIRLRQKGSDKFHSLQRFLPTEGLFSSPSLELRVGADAECDVQLEDPKKMVSRIHGKIIFHDEHWHLVDTHSKNGISVDGIRQDRARLEPGMEVRIGSLTLVAESLRYIELRGYLSRLLGWGWGDSVDEAVDRAMQILRSAHRRRTTVALVGDEDLVPIARELHLHLFGEECPFVLCDPRRKTVEEDVRSAKNIADPFEALREARGGTFCVRGERLPEEMARILDEVRYAPGPTVQIVICGKEGRPIDVPSTDVIHIPSLRSRDAEQIAHVVFEYFRDAERALYSRQQASAAEQEWVIQFTANSLGEISKSTRRLTALRESTSLLEAANRLDMAAVSLRRWIERRPAPPPLSVVDDESEESDA